MPDHMPIRADQIVIGCVTEDTPKYLGQALRLVQSIRWFGGELADARIVVGAVEQIDPRASRGLLASFLDERRAKAALSRSAEDHEQLLDAVFASRSWRIGFGLTRLWRKLVPSHEETAIDRWRRLRGRSRE